MNVALFIYNRPDTTKRVFEAIRKARPEKLFIIADGPKDLEDKKATDATREILLNVDWPCKVEGLFSDINHGCDYSIPRGLDWVFSQVDRCIILEDDCLPDPSFFQFCEEMLEKYEHHPQIGAISGVNTKPLPISDSYFFSRIPLIHGWATWRTSWYKYDASMREWPLLPGYLPKLLGRAVARYFTYKFNRLKSSELTSWDGKWAYTNLLWDSLTINPSVNLVENIAPRRDVTAPAQAIQFPLRHPEVKYNPRLERNVFKYTFGVNRTLKQKLSNFLYA